MSHLGFDEFAEAVIRDLWMQPVPLHSIASQTRLTVDEVLEWVPKFGLPPRHPETAKRLMLRPPG